MGSFILHERPVFHSHRNQQEACSDDSKILDLGSRSPLLPGTLGIPLKHSCRAQQGPMATVFLMLQGDPGQKMQRTQLAGQCLAEPPQVQDNHRHNAQICLLEFS